MWIRCGRMQMLSNLIMLVPNRPGHIIPAWRCPVGPGCGWLTLMSSQASKNKVSNILSYRRSPPSPQCEEYC